MSDIPCQVCGKVYKSKGGLTRHMNTVHGSTKAIPKNTENQLDRFKTYMDDTEPSVPEPSVPEPSVPEPSKKLTTLTSSTASTESLIILRCDECRSIRDANPGGWISTKCHVCGMAVLFCKLNARNNYASRGPYSQAAMYSGSTDTTDTDTNDTTDMNDLTNRQSATFDEILDMP